MTGSSIQVLHPASHLATAKVVPVAFWISTALIAFLFVSGGLAYALAVPDVVEGVIQLGFPLYFVRMLGVWKVLGGLAILVPGFPRLKEWAYAGILFDLTGASVASATMGASIGAEWWHVLAPLAVAAIMVGSWALRPRAAGCLDRRSEATLDPLRLKIAATSYRDLFPDDLQPRQAHQQGVLCRDVLSEDVATCLLAMVVAKDGLHGC